MYEINKEYFLDGTYWVCSLENNSYAVLEQVNKPSVWKAVRQ